MARSQPTSQSHIPHLHLNAEHNHEHLTTERSRPVSVALPPSPLTAGSSSSSTFAASLRESQPVPSPTARSVPSLAEATTPFRPDSPSNLDDKQANLHKHHQSAPSSISISPKQNRGGLFNLAALARDKTSSVISSFTEPALRHRPSSRSLYSSPLPGPESNNKYGSNLRLTESAAGIPRSSSPLPRNGNLNTPPSHSHNRTDTSTSIVRNALLETDPPSQAYSSTASGTPPPNAFSPLAVNTMHQTSSRLLRMTSDDRPFTRDFKDLFSTLVVSLPLQMHRVRLTRIEHSFLSEEAINNLGSLKFSQSNRMPDPKDPSRIVTTTTTTTFSMAKEMARSVCNRFLEARFIESADGKQVDKFTLKGTVWQLTPKGIHILERFCAKNGIQQKHVGDLIGSPRNTMQLVILERDTATDALSSDRSTVEVIFRRFIGTHGPNVKSSTSSADSDSLSDYKDGIAGVRMASERKLGGRSWYQTFTGKAATDWLMDCCTTVDRRETIEIAASFLEHDLIWCVQPDRVQLASHPQTGEKPFQSSKLAYYQVTQKGRDVLTMTSNQRPSESGEPAGVNARGAGGASRDSNTQKLDKILTDAALRLLFRENLRDTHCEENLSFYLDVDEFLKSCKSAIKSNSPSRSAKGAPPGNLDAVKETMASAYGIYNAFLAPGSPCELNIDHLLRNQLATRMTKAVGQDAAMVESLKEVTRLFEEAQLSVFKLMASDSVPKFMKAPKYEATLKNYDFDSIAPRNNASTLPSTLPERSMSRSNR